MKIVLATQNKGKVKEIEALFAGTPFEIETVSLSVEEDCQTFEGNAMKKAVTAMKATGLPAMADDSGLEVEALDNKPGVYSARFAGENATDDENNALLIEKMNGMTNRSAQFVCSIAVAMPNMDTIIARGECKGEITTEPSGEGGFGYDPYFYVPEKQKTFAELTMEEKNAISHRAKALVQIKEALIEYCEQAEAEWYCL